MTPTAELNLVAAPEAAEAAPETVGGKGRQLGLLVRYGLPVPDFFVIPAAWSRQRRDGLSPALQQRLEDELSARGWLDLPLAVRSSAVGEDGGAASFAGIFRSCLNVRGPAALAAAVGEVWASLDTPTAAAYRERLGLTGEAAMAVVVMPLVAAQASGIAFTCDPLSGREDRMVVHAHWGLGETLVGGEAAGDEYVFAEDASDIWRLIEQRPGSKATMSVPATDGGTLRVPVAPNKAASAVFPTAQAETLAALLRDAAVALDFAAPFYDLEWVWDGVRFWLTQARPVTRRRQHTYGALQDQPAIWTRGNTCEVMPEPLSPMDWAFSRRGVNDLLEPGWRLAGQALLPGAQRGGLFDGRLYLEASILQWEAWDTVGLLPERFNAMMGGHQPAIAVPAPGWRDRLRRLGNTLRYVRRSPALRRRGEAEVAAAHALARELRKAPLPDDSEGLSRLLSRLLRPAREAKGMLFLQGSGGGSLALLVDTLEKLFPGEGAAIGAGLLAGGEPSVTARQGYALLALAQLAAGCGGRPLENREFAAAFEAFLDQYGHRGHYETYLRNPRWHEAPEEVLEQLPALASVDADALRERQRSAATAAWQRLRRRVPWWRRPVLAALARAANRECNQREAARSALIALLAAGRRAWLAAGDLMVRDGMLERRDDIFLLLPSEAEGACIGRIPPAGVRARVAARAALFRKWQAAKPADWLCIEPAGQRRGGEESPSAVDDGRDAWRGVATGTGVARGRARLLRHPAEGGRLQPGEILVAPSTDPGWTPLFLKAGGLVVETGGYMSHGAIVAREFALPAVVNLPGILEALRDGDEIEVDGLTGRVRKAGSSECRRD
jgi:phosphohistidine swiveling domain-containing protein